MLVTWSRPWWEFLYRKNEQTLKIRGVFCPQETSCYIFNSRSLTLRNFWNMFFKKTEKPRRKTWQEYKTILTTIDNLGGQEIICQEITLCYGNNPEISEASNNKCLFLPHGKYPSGVSWESIAAQQPHLKTLFNNCYRSHGELHTGSLSFLFLILHWWKPVTWPCIISKNRKVQYYHIPKEM